MPVGNDSSDQVPPPTLGPFEVIPADNALSSAGAQIAAEAMRYEATSGHGDTRSNASRIPPLGAPIVDPIEAARTDLYGLDFIQESAERVLRQASLDAAAEARTLGPIFTLDELLQSRQSAASGSLTDPVAIERAARNSSMLVGPSAGTGSGPLRSPWPPYRGMGSYGDPDVGPRESRVTNDDPTPALPTLPNADVSSVWQAWSERHSPAFPLDAIPPLPSMAGPSDPEAERLLGRHADTSTARLDALRRRRRVLSRLNQEDMSMDDYVSGGGVDPIEDAYDLFGEPHDDEESETEEEWGSRSLYGQPNITVDDMEGWTTTLRRGSNNRRRISMARRNLIPPLSAGAEPQPAAEEVAYERPSERSGLRPTNLSATAVRPTIVSTRPGSTVSTPGRTGRAAPSDVDTDRASKKRRLNPEAPEFRPASTIPPKLEPSPPLTRPTYVSYTTLPPATPLPNVFVPPVRRSHLQLSLRRSAEGNRPVITFTSHPLPSGTDADACALRTTIPIPIACGVFYYEVEVLDQGVSGYMSLGFMNRNSDLGRLVGWDKGTFGYHADDGRSFEGQPSGVPFAEKWTVGDAVGCGVNFTTGQAFFTKNGKMMGHRFSKLSGGLYPAIGLRTLREQLLVNFNGPFRFDIDRYVRDIRDIVWEEATASRPQRSLAERDAAPQGVRLRSATPESDYAEPEKLTTKGEPIPPPAVAGPSSARLSDPTNRASAAFVLDYLKHSGLNKAHDAMQQKMATRGWVTTPPAPSAAGGHSGGKPDSHAAIAAAVDLVRNGDVPLIREGLPQDRANSEAVRDAERFLEPIKRAIGVYRLYRQLVAAETPDVQTTDAEPTQELKLENEVEDEVDGEETEELEGADEEVGEDSAHSADYEEEPEDMSGAATHPSLFWNSKQNVKQLQRQRHGRPLTTEDKLGDVLVEAREMMRLASDRGWGSEAVKWLRDLFRLIGTPLAERDPKLTAKFEQLGETSAAIYASVLRDLHGLKQRSYLESAVSQAIDTTNILVEQGVSDATFVDVRRIWEDTAALGAPSKLQSATAHSTTNTGSSTSAATDSNKHTSAESAATAVAGGVAGSTPSRTPSLRRNDSRRDLRALL